ncbi:MAG TPA: hypothetical protein PKO06_14450, partial [Candidatus Ozemobacteraceae bacterium]|nr:hypothetical protein [Candidatus Ozemobacteraceae bacterium]
MKRLILPLIIASGAVFLFSTPTLVAAEKGKSSGAQTTTAALGRNLAPQAPAEGLPVFNPRY